MRVGFTYDLKTDHEIEGDLPQDALAELDYKESIDIIADVLRSGGHEVERIGHVRNLLKKVPDLGVDIVFNICEGIGSRNRESEVPVILDLYKIPYVGSDGVALGVTLDKVLAKKVFIADNIPTPKYFVADSSFKIGGNSFKFPLIVKPRNEGSSKGISEESIVSDEKALLRQIEEVRRIYRQPALVEEFISGSEFTVLVVGNDPPRALSPVQIKIMGISDIGNLIYTSRRVNNTEIEYVCPADTTRALDKKLRDMAVSAYKAVDCRDFGRVDFRVDKKGRPFVLEINPLPSLSVEDVFPLIAKAEGMTFEQLVLSILDEGLKRYGLNREQIVKLNG